MISAGSLVRTRAYRWDMPIGTVCLVITGPYKPLNTQPGYVVVDVLFKGLTRTIDSHNVEKVQ